MYKTAKSIVTNLISLIEEYGFVLNGARAYYTNRRYPAITFCNFIDCIGVPQHFLLIANLCHLYEIMKYLILYPSRIGYC